MNRKDLKYITYYIGPVLHVHKQKIDFVTLTKEAKGCSNPSCVSYGDKLSAEVDDDIFCTDCGTKIGCFTMMKQVEIMPSKYQKSFYNNNKHISNYKFNVFKSDLAPFETDSEVVYVPDIYHGNFDFGIINKRMLSKVCRNQKCYNYSNKTNISYSFCQDCGHKLENNVDDKPYGVLSEEEIIEYFRNLNDTVVEKFSFLNHTIFNRFIDIYSKTDYYKNSIEAIEAAYGVGSVELKLAYVQYYD